VPVEPESPAFVAAARDFAARRRSHPAFRLLRLYTGCSAEDLDQLAAKIYCGAIPEETYRVPESRLKTALGLILFPWHALTNKSWLWKAGETVDWQLETIDESYFREWFAGIYAALPGTKRVSPRTPPIAEASFTTSPYVSARLDEMLTLVLLAPLMALALEHLRRAEGLDVRQAYRHAVTTHAVFSGYFSRHPCRRFVTFDDESNPPARLTAFRRRCAGEFIVVQNGERNRHPHIAFGAMDRYLVFGPAYERIAKSIGVQARNVDVVGAFILDGRFRAVQTALAAPAETLYDVLFIDQGIHPFNGLSERSGRSLETTVERLGELKARRPELRVAYQLRYYVPALAWLEAKVREMVASRGAGRLEVLDNPDGNASYRNLLRSRLVMTFESTLGFEALRLGRRTLFVNFSGDPTETLCPDQRFQLEDATADYGRFAAAVETLLVDGPFGVPAAALDRHPFADGRTRERIATLLSSLPRLM
jgi:hypothetical protein